MYARKKHLGPEALAFAEATLSAGTQPTKVRKLLQDKYGANLISKDLVNIKQTLTGKPDNEWIDTVDYMMEQQKDHNNVIKVLHNSDGEVAAIFVQLEKQRQLYKTYEDNNGDGQPVAMFLVKEETTDSISTCLEVFSENNDISVTKVTVTDKDCAEIAALANFHYTIKDVLQKTKRFPEVLRTLVNIILLCLSDRQVKQNMRELRFSTKSKHPLLQNYAKSISPYAWTKVEEE
ncbi:hypothetical protein OUZ56_005955 [Daphnia magna]|uniref:ZSWIM1/3 RNaseH-like domain-containing protein n=1 Tax=Daphnia magna TaxID=35525 RepID=A0ABQ9YU79_9CRUS|nr:hypothetical protein OUZ56_005955 [Daphnia magna]